MCILCICCHIYAIAIIRDTLTAIGLPIDCLLIAYAHVIGKARAYTLHTGVGLSEACTGSSVPNIFITYLII